MISSAKRFSKKFSSVTSNPFPKKDIINVTIGGGSGSIAYSFIPLLCSGLVFGPKQKISLTICDRPESVAYTLGNILELEDCGFPLLTNIREVTRTEDAVDNADICVFLGSAYMFFFNQNWSSGKITTSQIQRSYLSTNWKNHE